MPNRRPSLRCPRSSVRSGGGKLCFPPPFLLRYTTDMKRILFLMIAVIVVATALLLAFRSQYPETPAQPQPDPVPQGELIEVTYVDGEEQTAKVTYDNTNDRAYLTFGPYTNAEVLATTSASGARFANDDLGLVVWEKGEELSIYQDDETIFRSIATVMEMTDDEKRQRLTSTSWTWTQIRFADEPSVTPNRTDAFSLTFTADGSVSGTTDCNNFSGTYSLEGGALSFGSLMSTLMFCEGSQETEYTSSLAHAERILFNRNGDLTIVLSDDRGEMLYVPKR